MTRPPRPSEMERRSQAAKKVRRSQARQKAAAEQVTEWDYHRWGFLKEDDR